MSGVTIKQVAEDEADMRLDRWFRLHFPSVRHGELERFLRKGQVRVGGGRIKASRRLTPGEEVRIPPLSDDADRRKRSAPAPRDSDLEFFREHTIFEDEAILAINKPFGLAVQGGSKTTRHVDGMLASLTRDGERPRLVHRLDRDTGGLLLLAKTRQAAQALGASFKYHKVEKNYWALTAGVPHPREGSISMPIAKRMVLVRDGLQEKVTAADGADAKEAVTDFQTLDEAGHGVGFLALRPITGRTHQLRVHCAAIETPVVGDGKYGGELAHIEGLSPKLHLFCRSMSFVNPMNGQKITLTAPLCGHMLETWKFFGFDENPHYDWPENLR